MISYKSNGVNYVYLDYLRGIETEFEFEGVVKVVAYLVFMLI